MTVLLVIFMLLAFVGHRLPGAQGQPSACQRQARAPGPRGHPEPGQVRLEFNDEAKSLKRVEVPEPKARILAVDDEAVVLDSFRRILVLEGYSIDTVESGPEALSLVRRNDYDFVFTDLKMPDMDGVEVVKAVKHLRPDVDMVVITGYGTIETAVETMQHGASEYVQKPFSADELAEFVNKLLVKRQARLAALRQPTVRVVSPSQAEDTPVNEYCVPGGAFIAPGPHLGPHRARRPGAHRHRRFRQQGAGRRRRRGPAQARRRDARCGEPLFSFKRGDRGDAASTPR